MSEKILVVAAHPDDETLGCGGTMAKHAARGDDVHVVLMTNGVSARTGYTNIDEEIIDRRSAAKSAIDALGAVSSVFLEFPDNQMDTVSLLEIVQAIETEAGRLEPTIVYTHHAGDLNVDHRICCQAVLTAFRPMPNQGVHSIYGFEVCSSTEWAFSSGDESFRPSRFVDISEHLADKKASLQHYAKEMRSYPHARSLDTVVALAKWRGATMGVSAAEAFSIYRQLR